MKQRLFLGKEGADRFMPDIGFATYLPSVGEVLSQPGYLTLLVVSFLASTLLPLGSEWLLILMLVKGYDPLGTVLTATAGNTAGALTTWLVGRYGGGWLLSGLFRISNKQRQRAEDWYRRYGAASLLFSWLPVIGDPLCLVGGIFKVRFLPFLLLTGGGKLIRYALVAWLTINATG